MASKASKKSSSTPKLNINELEKTLDLYFGQKAPALPKGFKRAIVDYGPWLLLIVLIISLPGLLAVFGLGTLALPFTYMGGMRYGARMSAYYLFAVAMAILEIVALPGLFKKAKKSWRLLFYVSLIAFTENLVRFDLGSLVIGSIVNWYFLFQIKDQYK